MHPESLITHSAEPAYSTPEFFPSVREALIWALARIQFGVKAPPTESYPPQRQYFASIGFLLRMSIWREMLQLFRNLSLHRRNCNENRSRPHRVSKSSIGKGYEQRQEQLISS
jgi:hypothetical protein